MISCFFGRHCLNCTLLYAWSTYKLSSTIRPNTITNSGVSAYHQTKLNWELNLNISLYPNVISTTVCLLDQA